MTTAALKKELHKALDKIEDNKILEAVYTILEHSNTTKLQPFSLEEFYARNEQSQKQIRKGNLVTQATIKKRFTGKK